MPARKSTDRKARWPGPAPDPPREPTEPWGFELWPRRHLSAIDPAATIDVEVEVDVEEVGE